MSVFPKKFLWGAATSSHQVEGLNTLNDWWDWEEKGNVKERSGKACNHYELFPQDFELAKRLNHNAHRFSIEWSRIEPKDNCWDENALKHYREVVVALKERDLEPIATLHHFTNPLWFFQQGGWLNKKASYYFHRYVGRVIDFLGKDVRYWITINEPVVFAYHSYLMGKWPPGHTSLKSTFRVLSNLATAHRNAYETIHEKYAKQGWLHPLVSIAKNAEVFSPCPAFPWVLNHLPVFLRHQIYNKYFFKKVHGYLDFIGLNYYTREVVRCSLKKADILFGENCNSYHRHCKTLNYMGWSVSPEGLFEILHWLKRYKLPILITENGTCDDDDSRRAHYIKGHLQQIERALQCSIPIFGYLYWSLLDNFEWDNGFGPRFGLIDVDYATFKRTIRQSALEYKDYIVLQKG
ncbi:glycoside hydrolase family 1 protein [Candidatus Omnitrophota bacterium]